MASKKGSHDGRPVLMAELDIPIFFIRRLGDRQFVVGGGGGKAKSGIPNAVYLFSLTNRDGRCSLRQSQKVDIGTSCPMNVAVYEVASSSLAPPSSSSRINQGKLGKDVNLPPGDGRGRQMKPGNKLQLGENKEGMIVLNTVKELVAVGLDNNCSVYQVNRSLPKHTQPDLNKPGIKAVIAKDDLISIMFRESIETVKGGESAQQCCVFIPPDPLKHSAPNPDDSTSFPADSGLATGGTDGRLRIWAGPDFHLVSTIDAHDNEVTDMDISSTGEEIITCGKDKKAHVWEVKSGKRIASAQPDFSEAKAVDYRPRKARFHCKEVSILYIIWIPVVRQRKRQDPSMLCMYRFRGARLVLVTSNPIKGELLCALAVSPDGYYLATGNMDGTVSILHSDSLSVIYTAKEAHETFITDLEFSDCTFPAKILTQTQNAQCTLFSVSIDRKILLHQADFRYARLKACRKWIKWPILFWLLAFALSFFNLMDYITEITSSFHGLS